MTSLNAPHDAFFKQTFSRPQVIQSFLQEYLPPQVLATLDLNHLELQKDTFVDNQLQLYDLGSYSDEDIQGSVDSLITLLMLKYIQDPRLPEKLPMIFKQFV